LEETKAGLHGVAGAYDDLAITTEAAEPFKIAADQASESVVAIKEEWGTIESQLAAAIPAAIASSKDPAIRAWQGLLTDMETAQAIADAARTKTMRESWSTALPDMEEILAQMVREHEISLGEIPLEHRETVSGILAEWAFGTTGMEEEIGKWDTIIGDSTQGAIDGFGEVGEEGVMSLRDTIVTTAPKMAQSINEGLEDPVKDALETFQKYAREFKDMDGEEIHTYIYEHHIISEETVP